MDPIRPVGVDRTDWTARLSDIRDLIQTEQAPRTSPNAPSAVGVQTISSLMVSSSVQQLLQSVGNGLESNKMLEMIVTLLVLLAMLEQQRSGSASMDLLEGLSGRMSGRNEYSMSLVSTSVSVQTQSLSITHFQSSQGCADASTPASEPRFDTTA
jgi:hypothetical protein